MRPGLLLLLATASCAAPAEPDSAVVLVPDPFVVSTTCIQQDTVRVFSIRDAADPGVLLLYPDAQPTWRVSVPARFATVDSLGVLHHYRDAPAGTPGTYGANAFRLRYTLEARTPSGERATAEIIQKVCSTQSLPQRRDR